jgi:hypothetical protein
MPPFFLVLQFSMPAKSVFVRMEKPVNGTGLTAQPIVR